MTSIFEGQPPQNKAFSYQNKGHLGSRYIYIYSYIYIVKYIYIYIQVMERMESHIEPQKG